MMRILITQSIFRKYFHHVKQFAHIYKPSRGEIQIISNIDVTFNRYKSDTLDKPLMVEALKLKSLTTDISLYIADDVLCKPLPVSLLMNPESYYWLKNLPSPIEDIKFDIAIIDDSRMENFINYKNKIKFITVCEHGRSFPTLEVSTSNENKIVHLTYDEKLLEILKDVIQMIKE